MCGTRRSAGWGTSLAWWVEGAGGWSDAGQRDRLADSLSDPDTGLGLNVVRYNIGATGRAYGSVSLRIDHHR